MKIRCFKDRNGNDLVPYILSVKNRHEVVAPVSSVRIGETEKNLVKSKDCIDYPKWCAIFVGKNHNECKRWLDEYREAVVKLCIPYEVSS